jgi:ABC-2 type transport system permease protein
MNPIWTVGRAGLKQGLVELRQSFTGAELISQLLWPTVTIVAIFFLRDRTVGGISLGTVILPGVLGMFVALGMLLVVQALTAEREDGTLLRAKATPNGIVGYLIGKLVTASGSVVAYLVILFVPGLLIVDGVSVHWPTVLWVLALGLVATQSLGAALGALIASPRSAGVLSLPIMGLIAISGIFYPIAALPGWLQAIGQIFPIYWLGLGMRSALLPDAAAGIELDGSWRTLETAGVLGAWAVLGLILAPVVLRRMARRESGSRVAERREQALQRVG